MRVLVIYFGSIAALLLGLAYWATTPVPGQLNIAECSPKGLLASIGSVIHEERFWRAQLEGVRAAIERADGWDDYSAKWAAQEEQAQALAREATEKVYAAHPELNQLTPAIRWAQALRAQADRIEEAEQVRVASEFFRNEAAVARRCEAMIAARR